MVFLLIISDPRCHLVVGSNSAPRHDSGTQQTGTTPNTCMGITTHRRLRLPPPPGSLVLRIGLQSRRRFCLRIGCGQVSAEETRMTRELQSPNVSRGRRAQNGVGGSH